MQSHAMRQYNYQNSQRVQIYVKVKANSTSRMVQPKFLDWHFIALFDFTTFK